MRRPTPHWSLGVPLTVGGRTAHGRRIGASHIQCIYDFFNTLLPIILFSHLAYIQLNGFLAAAALPFSQKFKPYHNFLRPT